MVDDNEIGIDKARVERTIERFIQNDGQFNIYVEAPPLRAIAEILYARHMDKELESNPTVLPRVLSNAIFSKPSTIMTGLHLPKMARVLWRTEYQLKRLKCKGQLILWLAKTWDVARYYEEHPEEEASGLRKLFSPSSWFQSSQEFLDKHFLKSLHGAYQWIQEQNPLEQSDLKIGTLFAGFMD